MKIEHLRLITDSPQCNIFIIVSKEISIVTKTKKKIRIQVEAIRHTPRPKQRMAQLIKRERNEIERGREGAKKKRRKR